MREQSHEIGRRQLLGVMQLIRRQTAPRVAVDEVGNAYLTSMRTEMSAAHQPGSRVAFDGILAFKFTVKLPEVSCMIESKAANAKSSISKLPGHLADFLVKAYCVQAAWKDDLKLHRPLFLFVTNTPFASNLMKDGVPI